MRRFLVFLACAAITATAVVTAPVAAGAQNRPLCGGFFATMVGTEGDDVLIGGPGFDVIVGLGGNDTIRGRGETDIICGGDGSDTLRGGPGDDWIFGGASKDRITGGDGFDQLYGDGGSDRLIGGNDADRLVGGRGARDKLLGQADRDLCFDGDSRTVRRQCEEPLDTATCADTFLTPISMNGNARLVENDSASGCPVIRGSIGTPGNSHRIVLETTPGAQLEIWVDWRLGDFVSGCPTLRVDGELAELSAGACRGASLETIATGDQIVIIVGMSFAAGNYTLLPYAT